MASISLAQRTDYSVLPEGTYVFKVMAVDDSEYDAFGKLKVKLQTVKGETHYETFTLKRADGSINDGALRAWSFFVRTCLGRYDIDEVDTDALIGTYVKARVEHSTYTKTRGDHAGEQGTAARLKDWEPASGFLVTVSGYASAPAGFDEIGDYLDA